MIAGATSATAHFPDGGSAPVEGHILLDPERDIALLKIQYPAAKLKPLKLAATLPRKGEPVIAFGAPLGLSFTGLDLVTALTGAMTALANVGPGLGEVIGPAGNFVPLTDTAKWMLTAGMLLGRLEILAVLVLFTPAFWRG